MHHDDPDHHLVNTSLTQRLKAIMAGRYWIVAVVLFYSSVFAGLTTAAELLYTRHTADYGNGPLDVNLGYATYRGSYNKKTDMNSWFGIRFAEAPVNELRWQKPIPPQSQSDPDNPIDATSYAKMCPQAPLGSTDKTAFQTSSEQSEDCLFLNVWAPGNATNTTNLPVMVWIHGGGYGEGAGSSFSLGNMVAATGHRAVAVAIQYRLSAFGFLSSEAVGQSGTPNAGLHDQILALHWVQRYIRLFGGDPSQVTIFGESAGAGSVMLLSMANGGSLGTSLFQNLIAASPYLPMQHDYAGSVPSNLFNDFATRVGCSDGAGDVSADKSVFDCLVGKDSETLQNASYTISIDGSYGQWAFLPVTDHSLIQQRPSEQFFTPKTNGKRILVGNNADEGARFTPPTINTQDDFEEFLRDLLPQFTEDDIQSVLEHYPSTTDPVNKTGPRFATNGIEEPTAVNMSIFASGQQQRANNLYAEVTFVCPAYWLVEGFSKSNKTSYFYQYSSIPTEHAVDIKSYYGPRPDTMSPELQVSMRSILNSFIITGDPGKLINSTIPHEVAEVLRKWPKYTLSQPIHANVNQTGGQKTEVFLPDIGAAPEFENEPARDYNVTVYKEPGLKPNFSLANAYTWEGGRGKRCDFWRSMGSLVPE